MAIWRTKDGGLKEIDLPLKEAAKLLTFEGFERAIEGKVLSRGCLKPEFYYLYDGPEERT